MYRVPYFPTSPMHSYGADTSWLQQANGKAIIMPTGDVWGVVTTSGKSTSGLASYSLVWLYNASGGRPQGGGAVTVSPDHPNYETFAQQLAKDGTIVSIEDGTDFAKAQRGQGKTRTTRSSSGGSGVVRSSTLTRKSVSSPGLTGGSEPIWKNPWVIGGAATLVLGITVFALWPKATKGRKS